MSEKTIISIVESLLHPNYSELYRSKGLNEIKVNSIRKAISLFKKKPVDFIVAEFYYAYSSNYASGHLCNLDVLFISLAKYSPDTKVIVLAEKSDYQYIDVLKELAYPHVAALKHPTTAEQIEVLLQ